GPEELCDADHLGFDDDCDGVADEGCPCTPGQSHWCFLGDPAQRVAAGCEDGVEQCNELGQWDTCFGGKHAITSGNSCINDTDECTDLTAAPFQQVQLKNGTVGFSSDADTGSETYQVDCPSAVSSCPGVLNPTSSSATFQPLQSGQYLVTYRKQVSGQIKQCQYTVYVGASGMRVELSWDSAGKEAASSGSSAKGPDLDLHVLKPGSRGGWAVSGNTDSLDDCYYGNCRVDNFNDSGASAGPSWFSDVSSVPPRNWTKYADDSLNTCYNTPVTGGNWAALDKGCHNPRLDLDMFSCDANVTDPLSPNFCSPENVNFDELPDGAWVRVGVDYFGTCAPTLPTHPTITIYCGGSRVAQLGSILDNGSVVPSGFDAPVTFAPGDCQQKFWVAADVWVRQGQCNTECTVQPIYADPTSSARDPLIITRQSAATTTAPPFPPTP
ncbi:MAG: hypothetical protein U0165_15380, partial [Polyangiaceae bacterium]